MMPAGNRRAFFAPKGDLAPAAYETRGLLRLRMLHLNYKGAEGLDVLGQMDYDDAIITGRLRAVKFNRRNSP